MIVTDDYAKGFSDTIIDSRVNRLERIYETDPRFMQLQYPLFFPHGDIGFYREIPVNKPPKQPPRNTKIIDNEDPDEREPREFVTKKEYYNYKLMIRPTEGIFFKNKQISHQDI